MQHVSLLKTSQSEVSVKGRRLDSHFVQASSERPEITFQPSIHSQKSHRPDRSKLVAFFKLHRACENQTYMKFDACRRVLQVVETTCIKLVLRINLHQVC